MEHPKLGQGGALRGETSDATCEDGRGAARVLVVEDDADIGTIVAVHLRRAGFDCEQAFSGTEAMLLLDKACADKRPFDLVICDLMLPGASGEDVVRRIRRSDARLPVVVTSARAATSDKVDLLKLGADDYLAKPFDLDELLARVQVQLRHRRQDAEAARSLTGSGEAAESAESALPVASRDLLHAGLWEVDCAARTLRVQGADVPLTRIEFNIVELLVRRPNKVFTKQELFELAWGEPYAADDGTLSVHISNIRGKLKPSGTDAYIKTVWGLGFKLSVPEE